MRRVKKPKAGENGNINVEAAFEQGVKDGKRGPTTNPYAHHSPLHKAWADGYWHGKAIRDSDDSY